MSLSVLGVAVSGQQTIAESDNEPYKVLVNHDGYGGENDTHSLRQRNQDLSKRSLDPKIATGAEGMGLEHFLEASTQISSEYVRGE